MKVITRSCEFPGCGKEYQAQDNSRIRYCPEHKGGRSSSVSFTTPWIDAGGSINSRHFLTAEAEDPSLALSRKVERLTEENKQLVSALRASRKEELSAEKIRETIYELSGISASPPTWLFETTKGGVPGVPSTTWSDWHWGEVVHAEEVGGVNQFNTEIGMARAKRLTNSVIDLCFQHMVNPVYPGIVVNLGGDMITGDIHEELQDTNDRYTFQTLLELQDGLAAGLSALADSFGNVFVPCVVGNHGRNTRKPRMKGRTATSFEWHLYCQLERFFRNDPRIQFLVPGETDAHYRIYDHRYHLTHGDSLGVKGGDGIIGAIGPIMRGAIKVGRSEAQIGRDYDTLIMGHYHQLLWLPGINVNGCFTGATLIQTSDGMKPLSDVVVGESVLSHDGTLQQVTSVFTQQSDQGLVSLKVRGLPQVLQTTPNHQIWAIKGEATKFIAPKYRPLIGGADAPQWIPADYLSAGDWVHVPHIRGDALPVSEDLAWLYGLYLAEGWTTGTGGRVQRLELCMHLNERNVLERAKSIFQKEFSLHNEIRIVERPEHTSCSLILSDVNLSTTFREMFGHRSWGKVVPPWFLSLSSKLKCAVLQGWRDGDGHTTKDGVSSATTTSLVLAQAFFQMALGAGLRPSMSSLAPGGRRKRTAYTIHFNRGQESRMVEGEIFYRIEHRFRSNLSVPVYDLEVTGAHTYTAGLVGVHNSLKGYDEYARLGLRVPFAQPEQALWFTHQKYGITARWNILLDALEDKPEREWLSWQQAP